MLIYKGCKVSDLTSDVTTEFDSRVIDEMVKELEQQSHRHFPDLLVDYVQRVALSQKEFIRRFNLQFKSQQKAMAQMFAMIRELENRKTVPDKMPNCS